uniref:TIL domain-containing protein n=1 Tax=Steinernema glaseri TaxID=37863 RepID=A0A1I7ZQ24_9BILA
MKSTVVVALFCLLAFLAHGVDARRKTAREKRRLIEQAFCKAHEHYVTCGPEDRCEMSCDNLFSPPRCEHDPYDPNCFYPKCVCNEGFARDLYGRCVAIENCFDDPPTPYRFGRDRNLRSARSHRRLPINHFW